MGAPQDGDGRGAVLGEDEGVVLGVQRPGDQLAGVAVVIDDQDPCMAVQRSRVGPSRERFAGRVPYAHRQTLPVLRQRPMEHVVVEDTLLAKPESFAHLLLPAQQHRSMAVRDHRFALAVEPERIALGLLDAVESEDEDVRLEAVEVVDREFRVDRASQLVLVRLQLVDDLPGVVCTCRRRRGLSRRRGSGS